MLQGVTAQDHPIDFVRSGKLPSNDVRLFVCSAAIAPVINVWHLTYDLHQRIYPEHVA
jgi:hypothetical protein